jgi:hypothetical protein
MMCFSRPKTRIRGGDFRVGLILQIMTMIERKSSARAKAAREGSAIRQNKDRPKAALFKQRLSCK